MNAIKILLVLIAVLSWSACEHAAPGKEATAKPVREFYQLKVYTFDTDEQVTLTDRYLENALLPALKRMEMEPVGVFRLRPAEQDSSKKTFVLIPFSSLDEMTTLDSRLEQDASYQDAGSGYLKASYEQPPYRRIETILLQAFPDMPSMQATPLTTPRSERIYELRSYESPTEDYYRRKVDMFNAGGEIRLFDRLGFNAVFYGEVVAGSRMPNLMYMTTFPNQPVRDSLWKEFVESPEWNEMKSLPKYEHTVSTAEILFLQPTDYSDY